MIKDRLFFAIILIGLLIRIFLALYFPGFEIDVGAWVAWVDRLSNIGLGNFYTKDVWTNYTPGFLYILGIIGFFKNLFGSQNLSFWVKIPSILAEIILGILIYWIVREKDTLNHARISAALILLNPALIFNSAVWGQIDGLLTLFLTLTLIFFHKGNRIFYPLFFGLSFIIKPQAITLLPTLLLKQKKILSLLLFGLLSVITVLIFSYPFFPTQTLLKLFNLIVNMTGDYPYNSLFAYNFWGIVGFWIRDNITWMNLSWQMWGIILYSSYSILLFYHRKRLGLYALAALTTLAFFYLPTRAHERYLYPALIFLILAAVENKKIILYQFQVILSAIYLLNLYFVYVYYNEIFLNGPKIFYNPVVFSFLQHNGQLLSLASFSLFVIISWLLINPKNYVGKKVLKQ